MTEPRLDSLGRQNNGWAKAGPGRPKGKTNHEPSIWFRADIDVRRRIKTRAQAAGVTMSELIRTYIEWGLENDAT
jgi:hypothetical protein